MKLLFPLLLVLCSFSCIRRSGELHSIQKMEYSRILDSTLCEKYVEGSVEEKLLLARALSHMETGKEFLWKLVNDPEAEVAVWAAFGLGKTSDSTDVDNVWSLIRNCQTDTIRAVLIEALGKINGKKSSDLLFQLLQNEKKSIFRQAVLKGMMWKALERKTWGFTSDQKIILNRFSPGNKQEAFRHVYALYRLSDPIFLQRLLDYTRDKEDRIAYYACRGLWNLVKRSDHRKVDKKSTLRLWQTIRLVLLKGNWEVQIAAIPFLKMKPDLLSPTELEQMLERSHFYVQEMFLLTIPDKKQTQYNQIAEHFLENRDSHLAGAAYVALAKINSDKAFALFRSKIESDSRVTHYYAMIAAEYFNQSQLHKLRPEIENCRDSYIRFRWYEILASKHMINEQNARSALALNDMAVTTTIATALKGREEPWISRVLIGTFDKLSMPQDVEPMTAILQTLDDYTTPETDSIFSLVTRKFPELAAINKSLKHFSEQKISIKKPASLKWDFAEDERLVKQILIKTERGDIQIHLFPQIAPNTIRNMLHLARKGYFNGLYFHRVVPGFVIQGGDPRGDGWGGPGYAIPCEYSFLPYDIGMVGIATAGKDTGGSQFFITQMPTPHLDGRYTIWGRVTRGMEVVHAIRPYDRIQTIEIQ